MLKHIPNILTYIRIIIIPIIVLLMLLPENMLLSRLAATLFLMASITDFFDGYLARKLKSQTSMGKFLDPIADKLLVVAVIVVLAYHQKADVIPSLAIICREILVSGLREFLSEIKVSMPVSKLARIKTFLQMTALLILILGNVGSNFKYTNLLGNIALWFAAVLTILTGYIYFRAGIKYISSKEK